MYFLTNKLKYSSFGSSDSYVSTRENYSTVMCEHRVRSKSWNGYFSRIRLVLILRLIAAYKASITDYSSPLYTFGVSNTLAFTSLFRNCSSILAQKSAYFIKPSGIRYRLINSFTSYSVK